MGEAILYTILAIFAVYGIYAAVREIVLLIARAVGKGGGEEDTHSICNGCMGCGGCPLTDEDAVDAEDLANAEESDEDLPEDP